jgi:hypothetical protein
VSGTIGKAALGSKRETTEVGWKQMMKQEHQLVPDIFEYFTLEHSNFKALCEMAPSLKDSESSKRTLYLEQGSAGEAQHRIPLVDLESVISCTN